MRYLTWLSLSLFLMACSGSVPPQVDVRYVDDTDLDGTVSALKNFPEKNATDVPVDTDVWIEFSDEIKSNSVDGFRFQIQDELGLPVEGRIKLDKENRRIRFNPRYRGRDSKFTRATTYTVHARYLEDKSGYLVGSYSFRFRTTDEIPNTGAFYIKKIYPDRNFALPNQDIAVQFSEEVAPPPSGQDNCSGSQWNNAFQVLRFNPLTGDLEGTDGRICRVYNEDSNKWDTLKYTPDDASLLQGADYVDIVIRPTPELKGAVSGEELAPDGGEQKRIFVIPVDWLNDLLPDFDI